MISDDGMEQSSGRADSELCVAVFSRVIDKVKLSGLASLNEVQTTVYHATDSFGAIGNGGFYSYLEAGGDFEVAARAFEHLQMPAVAATLRAAKSRFPGGQMHENDDDRCLYWANYEDIHQADADRLFEQFVEATFDFYHTMAEFVRANRASVPDL